METIAPFKELDSTVLEELAPQVEIRRYPVGTYVFRRGDASLGQLFVVTEGLAEVTVPDDKGVETVVGYRRRNDIFGETVVLTGGTYSGNVRVSEELTCLLIPSGMFEQLVRNHPEVSGFFNQVVIDRMRMLYEEIITEQSWDLFSSTELNFFKRRVHEIMSRPVVTCRPDDEVTGVAGLMTEHNISSVVVIDDVGQPLGLITEKDLVGQMFAHGVCPSDRRAKDVMNPKLLTLSSEAFLNEALLAVIRSGAKHVAVTESGLLVGMISLVDLLRARSSGTLWVAHRIQSEQTLDGLREIGKEVDRFLYALVSEKAPPRELLDVMTELYDKLTRQVIRYCEQKMEDEGLGAPPVPYCFVNLGSAGRREQALRTDQDNAIVYADPQADQAGAVREYFLTLGRKIVDGLAECGFQRYTPGVVGSDPAWCRAQSDWKDTLRDWIYGMEPEEIRRLAVFLDFRPVFGEYKLADDLWTTVFDAFDKQTVVAHMLTSDETRFRAPLTMLGGFITEKSGPHKDQLNLKTSVCMHIVNGIRVFAMSSKIKETSTFGRLDRLVDAGVMAREDAEFIRASLETIMMFRIRENVIKHRQGQPADDYITPSELSKRERAVLRDALSVIGRLQKLTSARFTDEWFGYRRPGS